MRHYVNVAITWGQHRVQQESLAFPEAAETHWREIAPSSRAPLQVTPELAQESGISRHHSRDGTSFRSL